MLDAPPIDRPAAARTPLGRWRLAALLALPTAGVLLTSTWIGINFDIRYAVGGLRVAGAGGVGSFATIFVHRPLAYRALAALLDLGPSTVFPGSPTGQWAEAVFRLEALALVALVAFAVGRGLRRYLAPRLAVAIAAGTGLALALAPNWTFLEPDWAGALCAVAAVGVALWPRRLWLGGLLGGFLLLVAVALKMATAAYLPLALGAIVFLDRRRAGATAGWAAGFVVAWVALTWRFEPTEWQWLHDMAALIPDSPLRVGLGRVEWGQFGVSAANLMIVSPVVLALPAAAVLLVRRAPRPWLAALALLGALICAVAPVLVQAEWFQYQWVAVPLLTAGLVGYVLADPRPDRLGPVGAGSMLGPVAVGGVASAVLLCAGPSWRADRLLPVAYAYLGLAVLGVLVAIVAGRRGSAVERRVRVPWPALAALSAVATLGIGVANLPSAAYTFAGYESTVTNINLYQQTAARRQEFAAVRARIGANTPVLYLAFGDVGYLLGNPTHCRYPSPVWLQRSTFLPYVRGFASYRDNIACLSDPDARYLVLQPTWFTIAGLAPALANRINQTFDCADPLRAADVEICPRRAQPELG